MNVSDAGLAFIKAQERPRLTAYQDSLGCWKIGYGHTRRVVEGEVISLQQAEDRLAEDLSRCAEILTGVVEVPLTQNQFDALCSLLHGVGPGKRGVKSGLIQLRSGQPSTLLMFLNQGCYAAAAEQFGSWIFAGRAVVKAQILRREREKNLFLSGGRRANKAAASEQRIAL